MLLGMDSRAKNIDVFRQKERNKRETPHGFNYHVFYLRNVDGVFLFLGGGVKLLQPRQERTWRSYLLQSTTRPNRRWTHWAAEPAVFAV